MPGWVRISRPTTNFCRLPPDSVRASGLKPGLAHVERGDDLGGLGERAIGGDEAAARHAAMAVAGEDDVLRQAEVGRGGVAVALLRHEDGAPRAATVDADVADRVIVDIDRVGPVGDQFARQTGEQFGLAVAGDAGDADHLAGAHRQRHVLQRDAVRRGRSRAQSVDDEARLARLGAPRPPARR